MNFFPNAPMNGNNQMNFIPNDLFYKISELENKIKKLEQRIDRLENEKNSNNYSEPDTSLYMI